MGSAGRMRIFERCLWAIGILALTGWLAVWLNARWQQTVANRELDRRMEASGSTNSPAPSVRSTVPPPPRLAEGDLIGRIEIPRLQISTVVFEGTNDNVLRIGVGHLAGSPLPGEQGNVVLAAHRDSYFRALRNIRKQDVIDVVTPSGTKQYRVDSLAIVTPDHTEVLGPTPGATLTLVTCYPFDWFGHAPKRFIVRAHELDGSRVTSQIAPPAKLQTVAEVSAVMKTVDAAPRPVAKPHTVKVDPVIEESEESPVDNTSVSESVQPEPEILPAHAPNGNRVVRGFKKLNPKRWFGK
jgi:sortase A